MTKQTGVILCKGESQKVLQLYEEASIVLSNLTKNGASQKVYQQGTN